MMLAAIPVTRLAYHVDNVKSKILYNNTITQNNFRDHFIKYNSCGNAYIGSICGRYSDRVGIEKSSLYKFITTTTYYNFEPVRSYRIRA